MKVQNLSLRLSLLAFVRVQLAPEAQAQTGRWTTIPASPWSTMRYR